MADLVDEELFAGIFAFERGHWMWDIEEGGEVEEGLQFVSDKPSKKVKPKSKKDNIIEFADFNEDLNPLQQQYFVNKYRRIFKEGESDIVLLQDIIDVVLYTAPKSILSVELIKVLHTNEYRIFIRALIVYMQYYARVYELMKYKLEVAKTGSQIRGTDAVKVENTWRDNLDDIRAVVAKHYFICVFENKPQNKAGINPLRVEISFTQKFLKVSFQIVWIALERKQTAIIEIEFGRLLRSETFNLALHLKKPGSKFVLNQDERNVLYGEGKRLEKIKSILGSKQMKKNIFETLSPLKNALEYFYGDPRVLILDETGFEDPDDRISYMVDIFLAPENVLEGLGYEIGILGKSRKAYDPLLRPLKFGGASLQKYLKSNIIQTPIKKSYDEMKKMVHIPPIDENKKKSDTPSNLKPKYIQKNPDKRKCDRWLQRYLDVQN